MATMERLFVLAKQLLEDTQFSIEWEGSRNKEQMLPEWKGDYEVLTQVVTLLEGRVKVKKKRLGDD